MKRVLAASLALLLCGFALLWFLKSPHLGGNRRVLRVGINQSPPYSTVDARGTPLGFSVDVIREAARRAGLQIQLVVAQEGPDIALSTGKVDIWPLIVDLPERHEKISFTEAWMRTSYVLVVRRSSSIQDAQGAAGHRISVSNLSIHTRLARRSFPFSTLLPVPLGEELNGVCEGVADAAILGKKEMLSRLLHRTPECESIDLRVVPLKEASYQLGVGANKDFFAEAKLLRDGIAEMSADLTLARLYREWLNDAGDEIAIVNELRQITRRNNMLYWASIVLAAIVGLLAWLIYGKVRAEIKARAASDFTAAVIDATGGLVVITDRQGSIVCFNRACQHVTGKSFAEVKGKTAWDLFVSSEERSSVEAIHAALAAGQAPRNDEHHWQTVFGSRLYSWSNSVLTDAAGKTRYVIKNGVDISDREANERRLLFEANSDPLTGLLNRRGLAAELDVALAQRREDADLWLVIADLDAFKEINDRYGHAAGDDVLVAFGRILSAVCQACGSVARLGGDEFCLLLRVGDPSFYVSRIRETLTKHQFRSADGRAFQVAASFGEAAWSHGIRSSADLFQAADESLYRAKRLFRQHPSPPEALDGDSRESQWLEIALTERFSGG